LEPISTGWKLPPVAPAERDEIVVEIRAHIHDSVSGTSDPNGATESVSRLLGTPEELAHRYTTESLLTRRWLRFLSLALAAHQLATGQGRDHGNDDFTWFIIWLRHSFGTYLRCIPEALLPSTIGLWLGSEGFDVGVLSHPETQHELLGQWFVPVISLAAFLAAIGTTQALGWMIRRRSPSATYHVPRTAGSGAAQN
jgi:hypothetical protein